MKINIIDLIWSIASMVTLAIAHHYGAVLYGILIIYAMMIVVLWIHILGIKKRISGSRAAYATITGYERSFEKNKRVFPTVRYTTEEGREVNTISVHQDKEELYEIGSEELICYDPEDPMFFYFASREDDLTAGYYRIMLAGTAIAFVIFIITQI